MKSLDRFIEEAANSVGPKKCHPGQYYCFYDKKCKKIPTGYRVGYGGMLRPEKKNGGKNGNGGNGGGNGGGMGEEVVNLPLRLIVPKNQTEFDLGLMFKESLDQDTGMLFVFEENGEKYFHMKNTLIPLDVAFINEEGVVVNIKELHPLRTMPVSSECDALYAIEVNRGWFEKNNVRIGDKVLDI